MRVRAMRVYGTIRGDSHMKVGAVMVADDFVFTMSSIHGMQNLLNKAEADERKYVFSESKTTVQIINSKYQSNPPAQLLLKGNL